VLRTPSAAAAPLDDKQQADRSHPVGFPVRLAIKDLELVREVEKSSQATMPLLDAVLERFTAAGPHLADQDLAAIYELDEPSKA
jgi:3-hydroxyisobutyrate dehydrogenase-like beta-hydroxyacid dehydrogenase